LLPKTPKPRLIINGNLHGLLRRVAENLREKGKVKFFKVSENAKKSEVKEELNLDKSGAGFELWTWPLLSGDLTGIH